jgi:hypothetical protein
LQQGEIEWLDTQIRIAGLLVQRYCDTTPDGVPSPELLDQLVVRWLDDDESRVDINTVVNAVGISFGSHLAAAGGLDWVIATDASGSDLALHGQPGDIIVYPANTVAKRLVAQEHGFVNILLREMTNSIEQRRR